MFERSARYGCVGENDLQVAVDKFDLVRRRIMAKVARPISGQPDYVRTFE
jgi:hypothetical protein